MEREGIYKKFQSLIAKILASYTKEQRKIAPLSSRDEQFISDYKHFIMVARDAKERGQTFYDEMFREWANRVIEPELIFDDPIQYQVGRTNVSINLPIIHEWGLNTDEAAVNELDLILVVLCATFSENQDIVERCKERLVEMEKSKMPVQASRGGRRPFDMQQFGSMMGPIFNSLMEGMAPEMKEQLGPDFDANNIINSLVNNPKTKDIINSMQNGDMASLPDKVKGLTQDKDLQDLAASMVGEGKPTSFEELPSELQPPGSPTSSSSSSSSLTEAKGDGEGEGKGKEKEPELELE